MVGFPLLGPLLKQGQHIKVDFLSHYLSEKSKNIIGTIVNLIALISACVFFKAGVDATTMYYNLGQMMELEIKYSYLVDVFSISSWIFNFSLNFFRAYFR